MNPQQMQVAWLIFRVAVGGQFIAAGLFSALKWDATVAFNAPLTGLAMAPAATALGVGLLVVGGLSLMLNIRARLGAILVLAFLIPASIRHLIVAGGIASMAGADAAVELAELARRGQLASLAKNIALVGVVMFVAIRGSSSVPKASGS